MQALKEAAQKANPGSGQVLELGAEILTCTETFSYILSFSCLELSTQKCIQQAELFICCLSVVSLFINSRPQRSWFVAVKLELPGNHRLH